MQTDHDKQLLTLVVDGFLKGDSRQFTIIKKKITQYVYHQGVPSDTDPEEIVSEVIEILFDSLRASRFRGDTLSAFNVYIYQTIRFRINRRLRLSARVSYTDDPLDYVESKGVATDDQVVDGQLATDILMALDPKCNQLLDMKFRQGWSDREIADHLKKTKNATSTAISRCLDRARNLDFVKELL